MRLAESTALGEPFARAIAAKDREGLYDMLADPIDFRALTPLRVWEATTPEQVVDQIILGRWFDPGDHIQEVRSVTTADLGVRQHVAYRMRVHNAHGEFVVEQQGYYRVNQGRIDWLRILCSGYLPFEAALESANDSSGRARSHHAISASRARACGKGGGSRRLPPCS